MRILIQLGADVNLQGPCGSPLHIAIIHKSNELVEYLIKNGANIEAIHHKSGMAPLHLAISDCNVEIVNMLVKAVSTLIPLAIGEEGHA